MASVDVQSIETEAKPATMSSAYNNGNDKTILTFLFSVVKKATVINAIYLVGYLNWSITWLITPMILFETHKYFRQNNNNNEIKRKITKASAATNEKDVILAHIKDFPSWVMKCNSNYSSLCLL